MATLKKPALLVASLVGALGTGGCIGVTASAVKGELLVSIRGGALPVAAIEVFELVDGARGRSVCEYHTRSLDTVVTLDAWRYASRIPGYDNPVACEPLDQQKKYGVLVQLADHRGLVTHFVLREDGSASDLGEVVK